MIGRIKGVLEEKQPPQLLVDVQGVGYEVEAPMSTFYRLPPLGQVVSLHTHFVVREDAQLLYGFATREERTLFRSLIKVNGVGPKLALTILSGIEANDFARCVAQDDSAALVRLPGVGKKTADRLIVEMRDKMKDWLPSDAPFELSGEAGTTQARSGDAQQEAESALIALGYKPAQAARAIAQAAKQSSDACSAEALIRHALKSMV
ncbi:Holliday junction branch migration protein RuvA [Motiliproteus sediminis]|uniref:Holliday junction branch migration protein RuvA n=1 Tax=Motiliproteus sediminis TaxID=1468178 RepID=UPI001AEFAEB1|nr:Holliday junction branch migration protein RuvA [Motiliproteus sediminis]